MLKTVILPKHCGIICMRACVYMYIEFKMFLSKFFWDWRPFKKPTDWHFIATRKRTYNHPIMLYVSVYYVLKHCVSSTMLSIVKLFIIVITHKTAYTRQIPFSVQLKHCSKITGRKEPLLRFFFHIHFIISLLYLWI